MGSWHILAEVDPSSGLARHRGFLMTLYFVLYTSWWPGTLTLQLGSGAGKNQ